VPASIPIGSSTFVYHGRSVNANPTPHCDDVDDYDNVTNEWTAAELESLTLVERCTLLEDELITIRARLTATEEALDESLAHEANLRAQLDAAQAPRAHVSALLDGFASGTQVHRQLARHPSPLPQTPTTPSRPSSYRTATTTPPVYCPAQPLSHVTSPSPSQNSSPFAAPHVRVEALANYYSFLREHDLLGFIPSLDTLRKNIPISSWSEQMKHLQVPVDKIDIVMSLMAYTH